MTREEVIKSLENIKYINAYHRCREGIAIDKAIEALKEPERKRGGGCGVAAFLGVATAEKCRMVMNMKTTHIQHISARTAEQI